LTITTPTEKTGASHIKDQRVLTERAAIMGLAHIVKEEGFLSDAKRSYLLNLIYGNLRKAKLND
jgi:hypothetical protein